MGPVEFLPTASFVRLGNNMTVQLVLFTLGFVQFVQLTASITILNIVATLLGTPHQNPQLLQHRLGHGQRPGLV